MTVPNQLRAQPSVSLSLPTPLVADGRPVLPALVGQLTNQMSVKVGPGHLRVTPPAPPRSSGDGAGSSTRTRWHTRWSVETLPDPAPLGGYYWLGDRTGLDGTLGLPAGAQQWAPDGTGPAWHSRFPFKPSVAAIDHYLFGGDVVHHPKGVNFNSHYIEHMWMDFGVRMRQPFTWLVAACVTAVHFRGQQHWMLDAGRDPRLGGAPDYNTSMVYRARALKEDLGYRSMLAVTPDSVLLRTRQGPGQIGRAPTGPALHPKMFVGIFNGNQSMAGAWTPLSRKLRRVHLDNGPDQFHRYYVLGRRNGVLGQDLAGNLLVFEMRFFNRVLTEDDLKQHYRELAAAYHFHRYTRS